MRRASAAEAPWGRSAGGARTSASACQSSAVAAAEAERVAALNPAFSSALRIWLCALGLLGRDGAAVRGRLLAIEPRTTVADCLRRAPLTARDRERYAEGLRRAGLPEA